MIVCRYVVTVTAGRATVDTFYLSDPYSVRLLLRFLRSRWCAFDPAKCVHSSYTCISIMRVWFEDGFEVPRPRFASGVPVLLSNVCPSRLIEAL